MKHPFPLVMVAMTVLTTGSGAALLTPQGEPDPADGRMYAWYRSTDGVNGSTPVDGAAIDRWNNLQGDGDRDLDVAGGGGPVYRADVVNGLPALHFTGSQYLRAPAPAELNDHFGTINGDRVVFAVCLVTEEHRGYLFDSADTNNRTAVLTGQTTAPNAWQLYAGNSPVTIGPEPALGVFQVHAFVFRPNDNEHFIDGTSVSTGNAVLSDMAGLTVGARYSSNEWLRGQVAEMLVYEGVLSAAERADIEQYLATRYHQAPVSVVHPDGTPNTDFAALYAWYKGDEGVNSALGMPDDGVHVTRWDDVSGRDHHLVRTSSAEQEQPVFQAAAADGLPALFFDGAAYIWGDRTDQFGTTSGNETVFVVARMDYADGGVLFDGSSHSGRHYLRSGIGSDDNKWVISGDADVTGVGTEEIGHAVFQVHGTTFGTDVVLHHIGGALASSNEIPVETHAGFILGGDVSTGSRLQGAIAEVLVYTPALNEADRQAVEAYLLGRYPEQPVQPRPPQVGIERVEVFRSGDGLYHTYRIPGIVTTTNSTVLAFAEGRATAGDHAQNDIVMRRSTDGGLTWSSVVVISEEGGDSLNDPMPVQVQTGPHQGRIYLFYERFPEGCHTSCVVPGYTGPNICHNYIMHSDDDGLTWAGPFQFTENARPETASYASGGPGMAIQKRHPPHAGRIVLPFRRRDPDGIHLYAVYSDDGGETWARGMIVDDTQTTGSGDEVQVVELADGQLMFNARSASGNRLRKVAHSMDGGESWTPLQDDPNLIEPQVMASVIRFTDPADGERSRLLYAGPNSTTSRVNGHTHISYDEGQSWATSRTVYSGSYAYSVLTVLPDGLIGCLYEQDGYTAISLGRFTLDWLTRDGDSLDLDGDGLPDGWEVEHFGSTGVVHSVHGDWDGDGFSDGGELEAGTAPTNATDRLTLDSAMIDGEVVVGFDTILPGNWHLGQQRWYDVQYATELAPAPGNWAVLPDYTDLPATGLPIVLTNGMSDVQGYFRTRVRLE